MDSQFSWISLDSCGWVVKLFGVEHEYDDDYDGDEATQEMCTAVCTNESIHGNHWMMWDCFIFIDVNITDSLTIKMSFYGRH